MEKSATVKTGRFFNLRNSFMFRIAGINNELTFCIHLVDLLKEVEKVLQQNASEQDDYVCFDKVLMYTEDSFRGFLNDSLFDSYYDLGRRLLALGFEELGVSCQFLHHVYKNRHSSQWAPIRAWENGLGHKLLAMLPIIEPKFSDWEADTAKESSLPCKLVRAP